LTTVQVQTDDVRYDSLASLKITMRLEHNLKKKTET
jgi:hypothetical protein